ncbi:MAG: hypothetical protein HY043_18965 [Verrucomicrobia bacterium]|nr:hypothetical protein [Verrucomicrobiota bacterium]
MKTIKSVLLLAGLLATSATLQAASPYRTDVNPALIYMQAFSLLPERSAEEQKLFENRQTSRVNEKYGALAVRYDTVFRLVRRAADLKQRADWGVDFADGPEMLLPHLAKAKAVAQAAQFRARFFLESGKEDEAVQDLLGALALGRQASADGTLISTLVQIAIDHIVDYTVAENFYAFSPEALKKLMDGIDASPTGNTISQCIGMGERFFMTWYQRKIEEFQAAHRGDEAKVVSNIRELLAATLVDESNREKNYERADQFIQAAGGTSDGMLALVAALGPLYNEMQAVATLPYDRFGPANTAFFDKIQNSNNVLAKELFPALGKARNKEFRYQARLEMLRAAVQFRLNGEAGLKSVRDPFGSGPFNYRRFVFQNVDRGFELKSSYPEEPAEVIIFVEKSGPPFTVVGPSAGKPITSN